jgi:hypothetical protein
VGSIRSARVTVFHAAGCHLCERALEVVREVCGDEFELVDIGGSPALEERYRELIPVVEVDGVEAFRYFVDAGALRRRLGADGSRG